MRTFDELTLKEQLYTSSRTAVYRVEREQDTAILKILKTIEPSPEAIMHFQREHEILQIIRADGVIKSLGFGKYQEHFAILLEDIHGEPLHQIMSGSGIPVQQFLEIAVKISRALSDVHQHQIIHKDINPSNILYNAETGRVKLIDFGIASFVSQEYPGEQDAQEFTGSLAYISPEQTGRLKLAVDYRTDLYALGVMFYHILTGQVPFSAPDTMSLIHAHIARPPAPAAEIRPDIPETLSAIVLKLMAKDPRDRYQSLSILIKDLTHCFDQLHQTGRIPPFRIAEGDISEQFIIPRKIYGRKSHFTLLMERYERVCQGALEVVVVKGSSGIGKTAFIEEKFVPVIRDGCNLLRGRCEEFTAGKPYPALMNAFRTFLSEVLTVPPTRLEQIQEHLTKHLAGNGGVLAPFLPELEQILGPQPDVASLNAEEARQRFNTTFLSLVHAFAGDELPLVLWLDNMQWADRATLDLLHVVCADYNSRYLLVICAYRDDDAALTAPIETFLQDIRTYGASTADILLPPLHRADIQLLLADIFSTSADRVAPLAQVCQDKTGGIPFYLGQFLHTLHHETLIAFDPEHHLWEWRLDAIAARDITDNLVECIMDRLDTLSDNARTILITAACIGREFDAQTLSAVLTLPLDMLIAGITELTGAELILPLSEKAGEMRFRFLHERIQQAAYTLLSDEARQRNHFRIGQYLLAHDAEKPSDAQLFDLVDHLNRGWIGGTESIDPARMAELNLRAGEKAAAANAYRAASDYFSSGLQRLPDDAWRAHYQLTYHLHLEQAKAQYLLTEFDRAERLFATLREHVTDKYDRAEVLTVMMILYTNQGKTTEVIKLAGQALALFGISIKRPIPLLVWDFLWIKVRLFRRDVGYLASLPVNEKKDVLTMISILMESAPAAVLVDRHLFISIIITMLKLSLKHGNTYASPFVYSMFGLLSTYLRQYRYGYELGRMSLRLAEQFQRPAITIRCHFLFGWYLSIWREHLDTSISSFQTALAECHLAGDIVYLAYSTAGMLLARFVKGEQLENLAREIDASLETLTQTKVKEIVDLIILVRQMIKNLRGVTSASDCLDSEGFTEREFVQKVRQSTMKTVYPIFLVMKIQCLYLAGKSHEALQLCAEASKHPDLDGMYKIELHFYDALVRLDGYDSASRAGQWRIMRIAITHRQRLKTLTKLCPGNYEHKYLLVEAEICRCRGQYLRAGDLYGRAAKSAWKHGFLPVEALAYERAAGMYLARGQYKIAAMYFRYAYTCYQRWGAVMKTRLLEESYERLFSLTDIPDSGQRLESRVPFGTSSTSTVSSTTDSSQLLDLETVLTSSQILSNEIELERLLEKVMQIVIKNAGAEKGLLLLNIEERMVVVAEAIADSQTVQILDNIPYEMYVTLPQRVVNYVMRMKRSVVCPDAGAEGMFATDPYVREQQIRSLLCIPLLLHNTLEGILYLENNQIRGAFSAEREQVLRLLSSEMAISLKNARLFARLKMYAQTLEESEKKYRAIFEDSSDVIFISNTDGTIVDVSPACEVLFGYSRQEALGLNALAMYADPADRSRFQEIMAQHGMVKDFEVTLRRKDGTDIEVIMNATVRRAGDGSILGYQGILRDMTARKQAEQERLRALTLEKEKQAAEAAQRASEAANRAKSTFLANMSHELRTPLNAIIGFSQIMTRDPDLPSEHQEHLSIIQRSGEHLLTLINQVLDLSKIEAGRLTLNEKTFNLYRLLDDLELMFSFRTREKGLHLSVDRTEGIPHHVSTDELKLRQVLMNLLSNAVKFTEEGSVVLRVGSRQSAVGSMQYAGKSPSANCQLPTANLSFEIKDTGPGIAPEELDNLFEAFAQTTAGRQAQQGTGLGLAISRKFVQLMGGDITAESTPGSGSTFSFHIPVEVVDATEVEEPPAFRYVVALEPGQPPYRLLIVDDRQDNRQLLIKTLSNISSPLSAFELREAENGQEALKIWNEWEPHLIWMDMRMPVLDGYEATKRIRALGSRQSAVGSRQSAEGRRQKAEGRRQKAEGRRQKAEGSTQHPAPSTQHPAPSTSHPAPSTSHPAPRTQSSLP